MATQVYKLKITYADCDNRIWRIAEVSSNYTLARVGYLVLATFDTMAYHLFEMRYKGVTYYLTDEDAEFAEDDYGFLNETRIGKLNAVPGDHIEMIYDLGCGQKSSPITEKT